MDKNDFGIELDDAVSELAYVVEQASNFIFSEYTQEWETAERYFDGETDLPAEANRSSIVKTETRDAIRSIMPNLMRVLLHARKPVEYLPSSIMTADFAEQQSHFAMQTFLANDGYMQLYSAVMQSLKLKAGPIKVYWLENPEPDHIFVTNITAEEVLQYQEQPDIVVEEVTEVEREVPASGDMVPMFDMRAVRYYENGKLCIEAFPIYEFFVERNGRKLADAVHGHRRNVTVAEAIEMGLEHDNWRELDGDDPEDNEASTIAATARGHVVNEDEDPEVDLMNHEFLLTEAYCKYDMDGDGVAEKYVFYLGGSTYQYLHHERIEDFCIDLVQHDPVPFQPIGRSIADLTKQSQDTETAVLRSIVDNAMMANNPRVAGDPQRVNFQDLMNNGIGAPIRTRGKPELYPFDIPFTAGNLLPFMQYLEQDSQMRVGVTKAAYGLDPDAMQSTDKEAVKNTIQLSQGQVELMARNVIETGLIPMFRKLLRLSMRHMDKIQMLRLRDVVVPVNIARFDPNLVAEPAVGLGTASPQEKLQTLNFVYQEQQKYIMSMGMDNPFTSLSQIYNTLHDMMELGGLSNPGRYFNYIGRQEEALIAQSMAEANAMRQERERQMSPIDPGRSLLMTESMKSRVNMQRILGEMRMKEMELAYEAIRDAEDLDYKRDKMAQDRVINLRELGAEILNEQIKREQDASKPNPPKLASGSGGQGTGGGGQP
jgi:hypothetical protein